jgi:hypothetical protein
MAIVATYSSTLIDQVNGYSVTVAVVPYSLLTTALSGKPPPASPRTVRDLAGELDLELRLELPGGGQYLAQAIAALVTAGEHGEQAVQLLENLLHSPNGWTGVNPSIRAFALESISKPLIAVEESPLSKEEMAAIVAAGGALGIATGGAAPIMIGVAAGSIFILGSTVVFTRHALNRLDRWLTRRWAT